MLVPTPQRPLPSAAGRPLVIAHRGASAYQPENTRPAYALAVEQRADMIEIDLHLTRDGQIAIRHDAELAHLGGEGEIADHSLEELRELDAGQGERVPELGEVLDAFGSALPFNLEIKKPEHGLYPGLEARSLEAVESRGLLDRTLFSSFYDPVLAELRRLSPEARLALLVSPEAPVLVIERVTAIGAEAVNPFFTLATEAFVAEAHAAGFAVYPYTVDDPGETRRLISLGVDGLFTNRPDGMRALVDARR